MGTLKPQSNGPLHFNTIIGTVAVDAWAVTFGTTRRGLGGLWYKKNYSWSWATDGENRIML